MGRALQSRRDEVFTHHVKRGPKIAEYLARAMVDDIASRDLPPGTLLASEAQMIAEYGVGRGTLREALRILEVHGVIGLRPGPRGGAIVVATSVRDYSRMSSL